MAQKSTSPQIAILDYGMGNLSSVYKALLYLGARPVITSSPTMIARSAKLILPGVGAFGDAMYELQQRKLIAPLKTHIKNGKKFLGICLGLQLLFETSEESRGVRGLSVFKGKVQHFKTKKVKVPTEKQQKTRQKIKKLHMCKYYRCKQCATFKGKIMRKIQHGLTLDPYLLTAK